MRNRAVSAVFLCLIIAGCSRPPQLRVASVPKDWFNAPLILALQGWPGQNKPDNLSSFALTSGLASETAVAEGNADIGLASPVVLLQDASSASKVRLLGCYMRSGSVIGIASRSGAFEVPVGYVKGTISEVYLARYMEKTGRGDDYRAGRIPKVALLPSNAAQALSTPRGADSVNSVAIWEPHLTNVATQGKGTVLIDPSVYTINVCLIANRASYDSSKRGRIDGFAASVARASAYISGQPDEARRTVENEAGLRVDSLKATWTRVDFRYISRPDALLNTLRAENQAVTEAGMQRSSPDLTTFLK